MIYDEYATGRGSGTQWYEGEPQALLPHVRALETAQSHRRFADAVVLRLYHLSGAFNGGIGTSSTVAPMRASNYLRGFEGSVQFNVLRSVIDTAASMIVRIPEIRVTTSGSKWTKQASAKKLGPVLSGALHAAGMLAVAPRVFQDACTCRVGAVMLYIEDGELKIERVRPDTLIWNDGEGQDPRNLFRRYPLPRCALLEAYPDQASEIERLVPYRPDALALIDYNYAPETDLVEVVEGWHLRTDAKPGRHVVVSANVVLVDAPYKYRRHCIVPLRWSDSYNSYGGHSLGQMLLPYQISINRMARAIDEHQTKSCGSKWLIPKSAGVESLTNVASEHVYFEGPTPPQCIVGAALPAEFYAHFERTMAKAYEMAGVSMGSATGTKPAGLASGKALREYSDIANNRLVLHAQRFEQWYEACAWAALELMTDKYKSKAVRVRAPGTKLLEEIEWSSIDLREDEIEMRAYAVSALSRHPSGRMDQVNELVQAGIIDIKLARRMLDMPDTEFLDDIENASLDLAMKQVEAALWRGQYLGPEPYQDLELLVDIGQKEYLRAIIQGSRDGGTFPEDHMDCLRRLVEAAKMMLDKQAASKAPPTAPPAVAPAQATPGQSMVPEGIAGASLAAPPAVPPQ